MVVNYCPLAFMEESGKNRTPDKLPVSERTPIYAACDRALRRKLEVWQPKVVIGVGRFAEKRAQLVVEGMDVQVSVICHPSPANPKANRGWVPIIERELHDAGVLLP
jgi:single-strand selective monofunctional uracil DNA glycosylase